MCTSLSTSTTRSTTCTTGTSRVTTRSTYLSQNMHIPIFRVAAPRSTAPKLGMSSIAHVALVANAAAETLNGVVYLSPLRNGVITSLFGIAAQDVFAPVSGALMYLGGLHAAVALQCIAALAGMRSVRETLALMVAVHSWQCAIGVWRALKTRAAGRLASPTVDALFGAGLGPATGALLLGLGSLAGIACG